MQTTTTIERQTENAGGRRVVNTISRHWHVALLLGLISGFLFVASVRLADVPVPHVDEAYTLQVPYEMLNHGKLALPMYRYLGGNIENSWHSYTPLYFVVLSGYFKIFGWGLAEGRAFNLITAALVLLMTYLIGRRLIDWRAGLVAVVLLISDVTLLERSRMLRNDFAAAALAMLAFYLFEMAAKRRSNRLYAASGLAAGAGVMCHTNILYMLCGIGLLMLLTNGLRLFKSKKLYLFAASALAVMAYEIIYDIIDYENFLQQNRGDKLHFQLLEPNGWLRNIRAERFRYLDWYDGMGTFPDIPLKLLHLFQILAVLAFLYLIIVAINGARKKTALSNPRIRLLIITVVAVSFHALIAGNKEIYYMAHIVPWLALCVGVMARDGLDFIDGFIARYASRTRLVRVAIIIIGAIAVAAYGQQLLKQNKRYLREVRNPDLPLFAELQSALKSVVPEGVCPIAIKAPVMWLAFPEADHCFATIESRMKQDLDLDGKEHAVILKNAQLRGRNHWLEMLEKNYRLIGELKETLYGDIRIYYTGNDPRHRALEPKRFQFFGNRRGFAADHQVALAREIYSIDMAEPGRKLRIDPPAIESGEAVELSNLDLKPNTIYQVSLESTGESSDWALIVLDEQTRSWIRHLRIDSQRVEELFSTASASRVKLAAIPTSKQSQPLLISRISVRELPTHGEP